MGVDERYAQWSWGVLIGYLVILVAMARDAWPIKAPSPEPARSEPVDAPAT